LSFNFTPHATLHSGHLHTQAVQTMVSRVLPFCVCSHCSSTFVMLTERDTTNSNDEASPLYVLASVSAKQHCKGFFGLMASLGGSCLRLEGQRCLHLQRQGHVILDCWTLDIKSLRFFETSGTVTPKTLRHVPKDLNLQLHRCGESPFRHYKSSA